MPEAVETLPPRSSPRRLDERHVNETSGQIHPFRETGAHHLRSIDGARDPSEAVDASDVREFLLKAVERMAQVQRESNEVLEALVGRFRTTFFSQPDATEMFSSRAREERRAWATYLGQLEQRFDRAHAQAFRRVWLRLASEIPHLPLPQAGPAADGSLQLVWNQGGHHVEVDVLEDGLFEWIHTLRGRPGVEGSEDNNADDALPDGLLDALGTMFAGR